jgi:hypothetical protein
MGDSVVQLPVADPARLAAAVQAVLNEGAASLPSSSRLREGAASLGIEFQRLLEVGYLVASADGLDDAERDAIAALLETATGAAVDRATLSTHFKDLDGAAAMLGRRERLARVAADLEATQVESLAFAALIAMADGQLVADELAVLVELGGCFEMSADEVRAVVDEVAATVGRCL